MTESHEALAFIAADEDPVFREGNRRGHRIPHPRDAADGMSCYITELALIDRRGLSKGDPFFEIHINETPNLRLYRIEGDPDQEHRVIRPKTVAELQEWIASRQWDQDEEHPLTEELEKAIVRREVQ